MKTKRVYVEVSGGIVHRVDVPTVTDGTHTVIDWDNIEADPAREWGQFDAEDRAYLQANYPEDFEKYFGAWVK